MAATAVPSLTASRASSESSFGRAAHRDVIVERVRGLAGIVVVVVGEDERDRLPGEGREVGVHLCPVPGVGTGFCERRREHLLYLPVQPLHDGGRGLLRHDDALPVLNLEPAHTRFSDRRNVRRGFRATLRGHVGGL